MAKRALGSAPPSLAEQSNGFDQHEIAILRALALTAATISIVAGLLSLYWFLRMERTFRHHLIMLLITSNFMRALWYFVHPAVAFARGAVESGSAFCQASGFLLSFGIEGADFVVLTMAVHVSLSIFRPNAALGETGLYPYRHLVYVFWVALPGLAAGLAFVNPAGAYVTSGTYCYLPIRPFWYRLALAWCPRYIILLSIGGMYMSIYLFVRHKFSAFHATHFDSDKTASIPVDSTTTNTKSILDSGADTMTGTAMPYMIERATLGSASYAQRRGSIPAWETYAFGTSSPIATVPESETVETQILDPEPMHPRPSEDLEKTLSRRAESNLNLNLALRDQRPSVTMLPPPPAASALRLVSSRRQPRESEALRARHRVIRRQMRLLFVYPLAYLFLWVVPLVQHCLDYSDAYVSHPSFGLSCASTVILALQCAVDALLFCVRETPWRHPADAGAPRTLLASLVPWRSRAAGEPERDTITPLSLKRPYRHFLHRTPAGSGAASPAGKSKGERVAEAQAAQQRVKMERTAARESAEETRRRRKMSFLRRGGRDRTWWEEEGRRRNDSVMLGTDTGVGAEGGDGASRARTWLAVETIGEEHEAERDGARAKRTESGA